MSAPRSAERVLHETRCRKRAAVIAEAADDLHPKRQAGGITPSETNVNCPPPRMQAASTRPWTSARAADRSAAP